jgi:hypothetical protein
MADKKKSDGSGGVSIHIGGNVSGKVNAAGRDLHVTENALDAAALDKLFDLMSQRLDRLPGVDKQDVADAKENAQAIKAEAAKGDQADENAISKHLRNIARMGPDILDVVTTTLVNPVAGIAVAIQKIAQKARAEAGLK